MTERGAEPAPPEAREESAESAEAAWAATIADLRSQVDLARDERLRALADADNVRKRCAALVSRAEAETRARVAAQWLPIVDNLDRALEHSEADPNALAQGIRAVRDQAVGILAALGYARRDDTGAPFDPARHEAVATRPDAAAPAGTVVEVTQPAYGDGDQQLRPAQVIVARSD